MTNSQATHAILHGVLFGAFAARYGNGDTDKGMAWGIGGLCVTELLDLNGFGSSFITLPLIAISTSIALAFLVRGSWDRARRREV